ncbi:hypothetical protein PISL3812_06822 [Talaromyces islandicus]|uniref:Myb-like domain-containing protein n=1 Tax=Talaromyces islandicus TaxID=28573 RepID=A0A0U1M2H4_TALIS|nr:hypothetical protein PISL3812_06822 [Talaromyces islandicus]
MSGGRWTDALDKKLLLTYISINATGARNWDKVAAAMGPGFTIAACKLHFAKILKDGDIDAGAATTPDGSGGTPSTAGKKRKAPDTDGAKSPTKTPAKRQKKTAAATSKDKNKAKDKVKEEDEENQEDVLLKQEIKEEYELQRGGEDSD